MHLCVFSVFFLAVDLWTSLVSSDLLCFFLVWSLLCHMWEQQYLLISHTFSCLLWWDAFLGANGEKIPASLKFIETGFSYVALVVLALTIHTRLGLNAHHLPLPPESEVCAIIPGMRPPFWFNMLACVFWLRNWDYICSVIGMCACHFSGFVVFDGFQSSDYSSTDCPFL